MRSQIDSSTWLEMGYNTDGMMKLLFQSAGNSHASAEHQIGILDDAAFMSAKLDKYIKTYNVSLNKLRCLDLFERALEVYSLNRMMPEFNYWIYALMGISLRTLPCRT